MKDQGELLMIILEASFLACHLAQDFAQYTCYILSDVKTYPNRFSLLESVREQKLAGKNRSLPQDNKMTQSPEVEVP